jgi:hypothetical protein
MTLIESRWESLDGWSTRRKAATYTGRHKRRVNGDIYASKGIWNHDPSVQAREDI